MPHIDTSRVALLVELVAIFFAAPVLILSGLWPRRLTMLLLLFAVMGAAAVVLWNEVPRAALGLGPAGNQGFWPTIEIGLGLWAVATMAVAGVHVRLGKPAAPLLASRPGLFLAILFVYIFSVAGQEVLFRSYFFWRYEPLGAPALLIAINVLSFGWVHRVFGSWIPVALSFAGGAIFAGLYAAYHSLWGVCVVHEAFGLSLFAMGYGHYFYSGSESIARKLQHVPAPQPALAVEP